jgi:hypothetical protein
VLIARVRLTLVLAVLGAVTACGPSGAALDRLYDHALDEMRRGQVDAALATATDGVTQATSVDDALRTWRFELLAADAHLTKLDVAAALSILDRQVPGGSCICWHGPRWRKGS